MNQDTEQLELICKLYNIMGVLTIICATAAIILIIVQVNIDMSVRSTTNQFLQSLTSEMQGPESENPGPSSHMPASTTGSRLEAPINPAGMMATSMSVYTTFCGLIALALIGLGICQIVTGRKLKECKSKMFCLVIAWLTCINFPIGVILGLFTFFVLNRPSVMILYKPDNEPG